MIPATFPHPQSPDYALLDSGEGEKLERFGDLILRRPDPQALWRKHLPTSSWQDVDLEFVRDAKTGGRGGDWKAGPRSKGRVRESWPVTWNESRFMLRPTPFKHVGVFPEQAANWQYLIDTHDRLNVEKPKLLNLFGYTGAASVVAARAGYAVTHVDASKSMLKWVRENIELSGLANNCMRILIDDASAFVKREGRRGSKYNVILLDPPHSGRGPKGEKWQFETGIAPLIDALGEILCEQATVLLSTYAIGYTPLSIYNLMEALPGGSTDVRELAIPEGDGQFTGRLLPAGFCARWSRGLEEA